MREEVSGKWKEGLRRECTFVNAPEIAGNAFTEVADYDFEVWEAAISQC